MKYTDIQNTHEFKNIYILNGDNKLISQAISNIIKKMEIDESSVSYFDDENFDALSVINACNQFSFFNEKRVVVVKNLTKDLSSSEKQAFISYNKNPNADCVLLLACDKVFDFLQAEVIDCALTLISAKDNIVALFKNYNKTIDLDTANYLAEICLLDLSKITLEVKKISDYLGDENIVTKQVIDKMVAKTIELKIFDLTTALAQRNKDWAITLLNYMLTLNESPIKLLGLIAGQFRRMMFAKISKDSPAVLAGALGCKEFAITKAKTQSAGFTAMQLKKIEAMILEVDYSIKSGQMSQENAIYFLVVSILNV